MASWKLLRAFWKKIGIPAWYFADFRKQLACGHAIISMEGYLTNDGMRWLKHQHFVRAMSRRREATQNYDGNECNLVTGFFHTGDAEEISLFEEDDDPFVDCVRFTGTDGSRRKVIIGYGCADLGVFAYLDGEKIREKFPDFVIDTDYNFGWEDESGEHISFWDGETRTFRRESMSGRHEYCIRATDDGPNFIYMSPLEAAKNISIVHDGVA